MRRASALIGFTLLSTLSACAPEGSSAYVSVNIHPDSACVYSSTSTEFIAVGSFDLAEDGGSGSGYCDTSYVMHLQVNSNLRSANRDSIGRAEPNILQIHSAEVHLMSLDGATIMFNAPSKGAAPLPNPFLVTTASTLRPAAAGSATQGVVDVEAIPRTYAKQLVKKFSNTQIVAEVQVFGTTLGDEDIDFKPFKYPIQLCFGCLTLCYQQDIMDKGMDPADFYGDDCMDDSGQDGRYCIDRGC